MSVVKRAVSLPENVDCAAVIKSNLLFGGNFSAYICYLISNDNKENLSKEQNDKGGL